MVVHGFLYRSNFVSVKEEGKHPKTKKLSLFPSSLTINLPLSLGKLQDTPGEIKRRKEKTNEQDPGSKQLLTLVSVSLYFPFFIPLLDRE